MGGNGRAMGAEPIVPLYAGVAVIGAILAAGTFVAQRCIGMCVGNDTTCALHATCALRATCHVCTARNVCTAHTLTVYKEVRYNDMYVHCTALYNA